VSWLSHASLKQALFTASHQRIFLEDILSLLQDGIVLNQAMEIMTEESTGIKADVSESISHSIASGQGMAAGMEGWFADIYLELVRAGEQSGLIHNALQACVETVNKSADVWRACLSALLYPLLVLLVALCVVVFVKVSVLEEFQQIKPLDNWPSVGRDLYGLATWIQYTWWLVVFFSILVGFFLSYVLRGWTGYWRLRVDNFPGFKIYRQMTAARLMQTLGLLLNNGVMLKNALIMMQAKKKRYMSWHLLQMEMQLAQGQLNVAEVLDTALLDRSDMRRLRILATGKGFSQALQRLGEQSVEKKMRVLKRLANYIGGFLLGCGALVAMLLVFGIYSISQVLAMS
jgi:type II secretory pathway component PulF